MVKSCFFKDCKSNSKGKKVFYFTIPAVITEKNKKYRTFGQEERQRKIIELSKRRQEAWIRALNRGPLSDTELKNARVCEKHFISGKPADLLDENDPDWVPSQNLRYCSAVALKRKADLEHNHRYAKRSRINECACTMDKITDDGWISSNSVKNLDKLSPSKVTAVVVKASAKNNNI